MSALSELVAALENIEELLAEEALELGLEHTDFGAAEQALEALVAATRPKLEADLKRACEAPDTADIAPLAVARVVRALAESAAVLHASGAQLAATKLLARAEAVARAPEERAELEAAGRDPDAFVGLCVARRAWRTGRTAAAKAAARWVRRTAKERLLAARAAAVLDGPRPVSSAPTLATWNGCGTMLYGARARRPDGSYVATQWLTLLFVPVVPVAAYRVAAAGEGSYRFFTRERLSPLARAWSALCAAAALAGVAVFLVSEYRGAHRADAWLDEARALADGGDREGALAKYRAVLDEFRGQAANVERAVVGIAELAAGDVPAPCAAGAIEPVRRAALSVLTLAADLRSVTSTAPLRARLLACADEIGDAAARDALRVLDVAAELAEDRDAALDARRTEARRAYAGQVAPTRPLLALRELTKLDAAEDARAAESILAGFGDAPSLWVEAAREVRAWAALARRTGLGDRAEVVERQAEQARRLHEEDTRLLAAGDDDAIAKAAAARPADQELALAVARRLRQQGDARGAADLLGKLGAPGTLTAAAQEALAAALADAGELGRADDILAALCDERLPAFQEAQAAYAAASDAARQRIAARLQSDQPPADLEKQLRGVTGEAKQREIVIAWMAAEIDHDPAVVKVAGEYERQGAAVSATLAHGMLKLRRAAGARGAERTQHLAAAERAFLAIRAEAAGDPSYRLALAQVYYRLGKIDEAERELAEVLALDEPTLTLLVARTYRELGLTSRARQVAKDSYEALTDPKARYAAADLLAHMAPSVEQVEAWLRKDDPDSPTVQIELESAAAARLLRQGKRAEADEKFARASAYYAAGAKHDATSANNAAMGLLGRYAATGDVGHVRAAVELLEHGASLAPDNGLVHANLVEALELEALLTTLGRFVDVRAVAPGGEALRHFVSGSLRLPLGRELVAALEKQPAFVRALDVTRKLETLSPHAPDSYDFGGRACVWTGDVQSLAETYERVALLPDLAADTNADLEREWLSGERDAETQAAIDAGVAAARRARERVESGGSRPTRAFAATMLAEALEQALYFEPSAANVDAMLGAARQARELWPEGTPATALASSLFEAAFVAGLGKSPALARAWQSARRTTGPLQVAFEAGTGPDGAEVTTALRAEPTFVEAVALRRQGLGGRADLWDYLFARLAGDAELEREAAQCFERREVELGHAIGAKLRAGRPEAQRLLALVRSRGGAAPR